jgi:hypothetical protein
MGYTANATTGVLGQRLIAGFDLANVFVDNMGEQIQVWEREVSYIGTATLDQILNSDELFELKEITMKQFRDFNKLNLLANIIVNDEKVSIDSEVQYFMSGNIREIRVGKIAYRSCGTKYYGTNKKPIIDKVDEEL